MSGTCSLSATCKLRVRLIERFRFGQLKENQRVQLSERPVGASGEATIAGYSLSGKGC